MPYQLAWLIFLLPFFSFAIISLFFRPFLNNQPKLGGYITIASLLGSLALSIWALVEVLAAPGHSLPVPDINWVIIEGGITIHLGLIVDSLTAVMLIVVTVVSLMVQIYSQGYMHGDPGYHRYFAFMSLFTGSMLALVLADNLLFVYVFWEMVGLCSYLLIGFWFHRPSAANAAKKAFIVTRLGDFGFLAAILLLFFNTGTFDIAKLHSLAIAGTLAGTTLTWAAIGIFAGAVGKSAQFPLHVWLPDAMEGPTPVSALIHAATMVAAGVFLVARTFPLFSHSVEAVTTVAVIGGFTAIFAASMGLVMTDIKRVLAYSTISQLGYMMLGLGAGGIAIGIFHLFNHAFFKALLFLGAGSVNHATGTFDMREMGGLRKVMPWTYATFLIASLSIAGIWPLSGFWSKDEILAASLQNQPILFALAMITVFMTAFYMFRVVFLTFGGEYRGGSAEAHGKPHESPSVMVMPMVVLAILSVVSGFWNVTGQFGAFMGHGETHSFIEGFFGILAHSLPWLSLILAGLGILLAYAMYSAKWLSAERVGSMFKPLYILFSRKYWFDELYENIIVKLALLKGLFAGLQGFDTYGVDGAVNGIASGAIATGKAIRKAHTGQLQLYGLFIGIGIIVIILCLYFFG
jgi:NADH-quinone oxidoreductase subunit L